MTEQPTYYKTKKDDVDTLNDVDGHGYESVEFITDQRVEDPLDQGYSDNWEGIAVARATEAERTEWTAAYGKLTERAGKIQDKLDAARGAWEQAQGVYTDELRDAYADYRPVNDLIAARTEEVDKLREEAHQEAEKARARAAVEAQAKEDAELGARAWVTHHPNSMSAKTAPDMLVPVVHNAGCSVTKGGEDRSYQNEYRYARAADVRKVLEEGGPEMSRGRATGATLPARLCGRCKPEASLREALGEYFENWLVKAESVQKPMPTLQGMPKALGLADEWLDAYRKKDGYNLVSNKYYAQEKLVEPYETLVGWVVVGEKGNTVSSKHPEKLDALFAKLPARGFAVRRVREPQVYGPKVAGADAKTAVAVRRMTAHEIRQAKAGNART
ncbi:hypothetical protein [Streptomyces sp. NPDC059278]|uniref:hypothetical protein n=1 Tax=Streptomyces sp. NPDC059278 TaxID=3346801 RepID=UPI0036A362B3